MATIKAIVDPFIHEWGHLPKRKSSAVKKLLRTFMKRIGGFTESARAEELRAQHPKDYTACSSCGLCPKTHFEMGYFQTAYAILYAVCYRKDFMCHSNQPDLEKTGQLDTRRLRLCGNMEVVLAGHPEELIEISIKTMNAIRRIMVRPVR